MILLIFLSAIVFFAVIIRGNFDSVSKRFLVPYASIWFLALALSAIGVLDIRIPQYSTVIILIAHLFAFLFGFKKKKVCCQNHSSFNESLQVSIEKLIANKAFLVILFACLLYVLSMLAIYYQTVLVMQSLADVRTEYYNDDLYGPLYGMMNIFILTPLDYVLFPIFGYMCVKKRNWLWGVIMAYLLIHSSLSGGRLGYIRMLLGVLFFVYTLSNKKSIKQYKILLLVIIVTYGLIVITSAGRLGSIGFDSASLKEGQLIANRHMTSYSSGPIAAFDYALEHNFENQVGGFKHGGLTFTAFEGLLYTIAGRFGIRYERPIEPVVNFLQDSPIDIGSGQWNALYTSCIYYYLDFGIIGVIIIPFFIGILFRYVIQKFYNENNVYAFILLGYVFLKLMFSIIQYNFTNFSELLFVFFLMYMSGKSKNLSRI